MPAVYSTRLYAGQVNVSTSQTTVFTVPAGHRVVIRFVYIWQQPAAGIATVLYLLPSGTEVFRGRLQGDTETSSFADVRLVFHEGESCGVRTFVNTGRLSLHGYLLDGSGGPLVPGTLPA